jgi:hypothetical protein
VFGGCDRRANFGGRKVQQIAIARQVVQPQAPSGGDDPADPDSGSVGEAVEATPMAASGRPANGPGAGRFNVVRIAVTALATAAAVASGRLLSPVLNAAAAAHRSPATEGNPQPLHTAAGPLFPQAYARGAIGSPWAVEGGAPSPISPILCGARPHELPQTPADCSDQALAGVIEGVDDELLGSLAAEIVDTQVGPVADSLRQLFGQQAGDQYVQDLVQKAIEADPLDANECVIVGPGTDNCDEPVYIQTAAGRTDDTAPPAVEVRVAPKAGAALQQLVSGGLQQGVETNAATAHKQRRWTAASRAAAERRAASPAAVAAAGTDRARG